MLDSDLATLYQVGTKVLTSPLNAMANGVLHSDRAIEVNIAIMQTFVLVREFALDYANLPNGCGRSKASLRIFTKRSVIYRSATSSS